MASQAEMASQAGRYHLDENISITGKSPNFYKIILAKTIREGKFVIPMKFVDKFGNYLSSPISLQDPSGKSWQVQLLKIGDELWIEKGWQEFSEHHSLKYGHLVLFKYEGGCHFNVLIFDTTAVEIKYPGSRIPSMDPNHGRDFQQPEIQAKEDEDEDVISCEILNNPTSKANQFSKDPHASNEKSEGGLLDENGISRQARKLLRSGTCEALKAVNKMSKHQYPSVKTAIRHKHMVSIPYSFIETYMKCEPQLVKLRVGGKSWSVKLNVYTRTRASYISCGWSAFARENCLKVGDVCIFALIDSNVMLVSNSKLQN